MSGVQMSEGGRMSGVQMWGGGVSNVGGSNVGRGVDPHIEPQQQDISSCNLEYRIMPSFI